MDRRILLQAIGWGAAGAAFAHHTAARATKFDCSLTVVVKLTAKEGKQEDLKRHLLALVEPTRREEGCLTYDLHQGIENPAMFLLYENWRSQEHLDQHFQMPYMKEWVEIRDSYLAAREVTRWALIR